MGLVYFQKENSWDMDGYPLSNYLKDALHSKHHIQGHYVCNSGYSPQIHLYVDLLNEQKNHVSFKDWNLLIPGDHAIVAQSKIQKEIETRYLYSVVENDSFVKIYSIYGIQ